MPSWGKEEDCGGLGDGLIGACTTATAAPAMISATLSLSFFAVLPLIIFIGGGSSILSPQRLVYPTMQRGIPTYGGRPTGCGALVHAVGPEALESRISKGDEFDTGHMTEEDVFTH